MAPKKGKKAAKNQKDENIQKGPQDTKGGSDEDTETKATTDSFEHIGNKEHGNLNSKTEELEKQVSNLKKAQEDLQKKVDDSKKLQDELNSTKEQLELAEKKIDTTEAYLKKNHKEEISKLQTGLQEKEEESKKLGDELKVTKQKLEDALLNLEILKAEFNEHQNTSKNHLIDAKDFAEKELKLKHTGEISALKQKVTEGERNGVQLRETKEFLKEALKEQENLENQVSNLQRKLANVQGSSSGTDTTNIIGGMVAVWIPMVYLFSNFIN